MSYVGKHPSRAAERWCVDIPFGVYLGWISVATIANITDWLYAVQWDGFGIAPAAWAVIMLAVATLLGALMARTRRDAAYLLVLVWSFAGIAIKQTATPLVAGSAWLAAVVVAGLALYSTLRHGRVAV